MHDCIFNLLHFVVHNMIWCRLFIYHDFEEFYLLYKTEYPTILKFNVSLRVNYT